MVSIMEEILAAAILEEISNQCSVQFYIVMSTTTKMECVEKGEME